MANVIGFESDDAGFMVNWPFVWPRALAGFEGGTLDQSVPDDYGWALYPRVLAGLRREQLPAFVARFGRTGRSHAAHSPARLSHAVDRSLRLGARRPRCLVSSLVLYRILREQGDDAELVIGLPQTPVTCPMAKPNYSFEKRQREIAQKKKADEKAARECLSLPIYPELTDGQVQRVAKVVKEFFGK